MKKLFMIFGFLFLWTIAAVNPAWATFPVVQSAGHIRNAASTTPNVTVPSGIQNNDRLVGFFCFNANPTLSNMPAGWTQIFRRVVTGALVTVEVWHKLATGSESNFTYTLNSSQASVNRVLRISGAHTSTAPEAAHNEDTSQSDANDPDPPSLNPTNWDVEDTLWIAYHCIDHGARATSGYPSNYNDNQFEDSTGAADPAEQSIGIATRNLRAASDNPGAFTVTHTDEWISATIAVRPSVPNPVTRRPIPPIIFQ